MHASFQLMFPSNCSMDAPMLETYVVHPFVHATLAPTPPLLSSSLPHSPVLAALNMPSPPSPRPYPPLTQGPLCQLRHRIPDLDRCHTAVPLPLLPRPPSLGSLRHLRHREPDLDRCHTAVCALSPPPLAPLLRLSTPPAAPGTRPGPLPPGHIITMISIVR